MLIRCKTVILILLFSTGVRYLYAGNFNSEKVVLDRITKSLFDKSHLQEHAPLFSEDTINTESPKNELGSKDEFLIPARLAGKTFDFRVNADISYLTFKHFTKSAAKKMFFQAWIKEKELGRTSLQTDSLRKIYAISTDAEKAEIATVILRNEERTMALNSEIPVLYQNARDLEDQYWQTRPSDEKVRFQEMIKLFRDSLTVSKSN